MTEMRLSEEQSDSKSIAVFNIQEPKHLDCVNSESIVLTRLIRLQVLLVEAWASTAVITGSLHTGYTDPAMIAVEASIWSVWQLTMWQTDRQTMVFIRVEKATSMQSNRSQHSVPLNQQTRLFNNNDLLRALSNAVFVLLYSWVTYKSNP